jgi:uncharacterized protein
MALAVGDLPALPPTTHVIDQAQVLSRAANGDIEKALAALEADHIEAQLITIDRLDYGVSLDQLGQQLLQKWHDAAPDQSRLLVLLDTQTRAAALVADPSVERQLTPDLLRSTARTTMAAGCSRIAATIKRVATTTNCRATRDGDREKWAMVPLYRHERHCRR